MSAVDKRLYYLMLSPSIGQEFAHMAGFSSPSEEVQESETYDVIGRWAVITTGGILGEILEAVDWFCDLQELETDEDREDLHRTLVSHSVALVNKLLDRKKVMLVLDISEIEELTDE